MSEDNEKEYVLQLISLLNGLNCQYGQVVSDFIPIFRARDVWECCASCAELYHRYLSLCVSKPTAPSDVLDRLASTSVSPLKRDQTDLYLEKVTSCGNVVFPDGFDGFWHIQDRTPLEIWGHVLDVCGGTLGETNALVIDSEFKEFCACAMNEKREFVEWSVKERSQRGTMLCAFLTKSYIILDQMRSVVLQRLDGIDVNEHPNARLARVLYYMRRFRDKFFGYAAAIGPCLPGARSPDAGFADWFAGEDAIETELGEEPGILRVEQGGGNIGCSFRPTNGNTVKWEINEWTGEMVLPKYEPIPEVESTIFCTWSYTTGEFLGFLDYETESRAYWYVSDDSQISAAARIVKEEAYPLITNKEYESLAKRAMDIVYNNQPAWSVGRVQWSYVRDVDEVIAAFEHALRVYGLKHGISTPTIPVGKQAGRQDDDIPPDHKSPPMGLEELAGYFKNSISQKKIRAMINCGSIGAEKINRQSYYFDLRTVPGYVRKEIEGLMH